MYLTSVCQSPVYDKRWANQMIKIMKLTTVFMITLCLQVSAESFSQKVTIKGENISIQRIFEDIRKQTGFQFLYADDALKTAKPISLSVRKEKLENVLALCFKDQLLTYTITDKTIVVKRKTPEPIVIPGIQPAPVIVPDVKGRVTDNNGQPLADVSVSVKGTTRGTITDASGNFSLSVSADDILVFSYVGFKTIEQKVGTNNTISISLKPVENAIDEIVVVGYGTQKKRDLTGSVSSIKGEEVANRPATNPIASLQGRVAGLTIANSGVAGASPVVRIRGINSTNTASPVYVVDGVLHDNIEFLNPADIETIDILRDHSSIAIYGLRGANGVIAITSKKAARGQTRI